MAVGVLRFKSTHCSAVKGCVYSRVAQEGLGERWGVLAFRNLHKTNTAMPKEHELKLSAIHQTATSEAVNPFKFNG